MHFNLVTCELSRELGRAHGKMQQTNVTSYFLQIETPATSGGDGSSINTDDPVEDDAAPRSKHRKTGIDPQWSTDFKWLLCVEEDSGMLCSMCRKHSRHPTKVAIGKAPWVDVPCKTLVRQSLVLEIDVLMLLSDLLCIMLYYCMHVFELNLCQHCSKRAD